MVELVTAVVGGVPKPKAVDDVAAGAPKENGFDSAPAPGGVAGGAPNAKGFFAASVVEVEAAGAPKANFVSTVVAGFVVGAEPLTEGGALNAKNEDFGASTVVAGCVAIDVDATALSETTGAIFSLLAAPAG